MHSIVQLNLLIEILWPLVLFGILAALRGKFVPSQIGDGEGGRGGGGRRGGREGGVGGREGRDGGREGVRCERERGRGSEGGKEGREGGREVG